MVDVVNNYDSYFVEHNMGKMGLNIVLMMFFIQTQFIRI